MRKLKWPAWMRRTHPIVRYEAGHWARSRGWRAARQLVWGGSLTFIMAPAACAILFNLQSQFTSPAEAILAFGGVFCIGLALLSSLAVWFSNLSATIVGATLVARERESQNWPFLRLTSLTSLDLVGGKLMALFYILIGPVQLITGLRLLALAAGLVTLILAYLATGLTGRDASALAASVLQEFNLTTGQWVGLIATALLSVLWVVGNWLIEPLFGLLYNGVIGITMSSLARSRGTAIVLAFAAHLGLALGLYAPVSQLSSLALAPLAASGNQDTALIVVVVAVAFVFVLETLLPWAVMIACAIFTLWRVESLSD